MRETSRRILRFFPWIVVMIYVAIALFTVLDYGISVDERLQAAYGEMVVDYYKSGFQVRQYETFSNLRFYGPAFEVLPALFYRSFPFWKFEIRHLFIVLASLLGLAGVLKIGQRIDRSGLLASFAVLSLLLMPAYYGHTFFNSKDIPFAAAFTWSIYFLMDLAEKPGWKRLLPAGLAGGAALGIRVGGVLAFALLLIAIIIQSILLRESRHEELRKIPWLIAAGAIAWTVMTMLWPWAQSDPIGNPLQALRSATAFPDIYRVRFAGEYWPSNALPARYLTQMLLITTPLPIVTLILVGVVAAIRRVRSRIDTFAYVLLLVWAIVPPLLQVALRSPLYDGTRHFLFLFPALALLAAIGGWEIVQLVNAKAVATAGILVALLAVVGSMVQLHPYQYVYYNQLVGGPAGAAEGYELDYWSTSYREAALWINEHLCADGGTSLLIAARPLNESSTAYFLPQQVKVSAVGQYGIPGALSPEYDYYAGIRRQQMEMNFPDTPIIHRIERMGATLAVIRGGCK